MIYYINYIHIILILIPSRNCRDRYNSVRKDISVNIREYDTEHELIQAKLVENFFYNIYV